MINVNNNELVLFGGGSIALLASCLPLRLHLGRSNHAATLLISPLQAPWRAPPGLPITSPGPRRHNGVFKDFTTNVLNYLEAGRNVSFFSATRISRQVDVDERILGKLTFAVSLLCRDPPHPPAVRDIPIPTFGVPEAAPPMSCSSRSCCGYCREWFVSLHAGCARHKPIKP